MSSEAIGCNHSNPAIYGIIRAILLFFEKITAQGDNLLLGIWVIEHGKIAFCPVAITGNDCEPYCNVLGTRGEETRFRKDPGEWVCIICENPPAKKAGFNRSSPPSAERIIYDITFMREQIDKKSCNCGLKQAR